MGKVQGEFFRIRYMLQPELHLPQHMLDNPVMRALSPRANSPLLKTFQSTHCLEFTYLSNPRSVHQDCFTLAALQRSQQYIRNTERSQRLQVNEAALWLSAQLLDQLASEALTGLTAPADNPKASFFLDRSKDSGVLHLHLLCPLLRFSIPLLFLFAQSSYERVSRQRCPPSKCLIWNWVQQ